MPEEWKKIQVDVYTEDKQVLRTAECCKPHSLKKMNLTVAAVS
jgi:hypothetical protein